MKNIFLYGPPGSGKTTVGKLLANKLDYYFIDIDEEIEKVTGLSIPAIMSGQGEAKFRDIEADVIHRCASAPDAVLGHTGQVIALGGGALLRDSSREFCEAIGQVILLEANYHALADRIRNDPTNERPLLSGELESRLMGLLERRSGHYSSFSIRIGTQKEGKNIDPAAICWSIQTRLGIFRVSSMGKPYDILVQPGGVHHLGEYLRQRNLGGPALIVTDENIGPHYAAQAQFSLQKAGYACSVVTLKSGEENKNLETISTLWKAFLEAGLDRKSTVIALGGGVVGDLTGFAASTYMRGCSWVAVPTSLLAMVDASMGGKTGFDLPEGKNLIGSFYSPALVLADPEVLHTLPEGEFRSGLAEVVKHGIISDPELYQICAGGYDAIRVGINDLVGRAMSVKVQVIEKDPYEAGIRAALNLGHTIGHAVELASGFTLRHGEAVSIGMVAEARLAERMGLTERADLSGEIKSTLENLGLPTEIPATLAKPVILDAMRRDKKKSSNVIKFALPVNIGKVNYKVPVTKLEDTI